MKTNTLIIRKNGVELYVYIPLTEYNDLEFSDIYFDLDTMYKLKKEVYYSDPKVECEIINYNKENLGKCEYDFLINILSTEIGCGRNNIKSIYEMFYEIITKIVNFKYIINPIENLACDIRTKEIYNGDIYDVYNAFGINKFCRKMGSLEDFTLGINRSKNFISEGGSSR